MAFQNSIEALVTVSVFDVPKGKAIKAEFLAADGTLLTAYNPEGVKSIDWVKRRSNNDGKEYVESRRPIIVTYSCARKAKGNSCIAEDCKLYPIDFSFLKRREDTPDCILETEWVKVTPRCQSERKRDATPDVMFPGHDFPFMLGRKWGDESKCSTDPINTRPAIELCPLRVNGESPNADSHKHLVRAYASIMLDRETNARQFHRILFSQEQWDRLAREVHEGEKVILKGCEIQYDLRDEEVIVNTETHYDYGDGEGFTTGVSDKYIPGVVTNVRSIAIERELSLTKANDNDQEPQYATEPFLSTFDELYEDAYARYDPEPDDFYDDYEPRLSDYYDDMEELELNTRGDGYD